MSDNQNETDHALDPMKPQHSAMQITFETKAELYSAFMPFLKNGGLFIHTKKPFNLGDDVFLLVQLMDESEKYPANGKVVWHTPIGAQSGMLPGIGIQFTEKAADLRKKIETYLAGTANSDKRTDTM